MESDGKAAASGQAGNCPTLAFELVVRDSVEAMRKDLVAICRSTCASWAEARVEDPDIMATQVQGGITNLLYLMVHKGLKAEENRSLLVRVFGKKTDLMIDRNRDNGVMRMLSDLDFGPPCHGFFENGRVEGFFESFRALKPSEMSDPRIMPLVAAELARMHSLAVTAHPNSKLVGARSPSLWQTIDSWLEKIKNDVKFGIVGEKDMGGDGAAPEARGGVESEVTAMKEAEKKRTLELLDVEEMAREIAWLKSVLPTADDADEIRGGRGEELAAAATTAGPGGEASSASSTSSSSSSAAAAAAAVAAAKAAAAAANFTDAVVFAHNDALAGNILYDEKADGSRGEVRLIDFEYGSWNFRGFDLANHFCEFAGFDCDYFRGFPSREMQEAFVVAYVGESTEFYSGVEAKALFMEAVYGWSFFLHLLPMPWPISSSLFALLLPAASKLASGSRLTDPPPPAPPPPPPPPPSPCTSLIVTPHPIPRLSLLRHRPALCLFSRLAYILGSLGCDTGKILAHRFRLHGLRRGQVEGILLPQGEVLRQHLEA